LKLNGQHRLAVFQLGRAVLHWVLSNKRQMIQRNTQADIHNLFLFKGRLK